MDPGVIGGVAAAVGVPVVFGLLAKSAPYHPPDGYVCDVPYEELAQRYARWELAALVPVFGFTALFTFLWSGLFRLLQSLAVSQLPADRFRLDPSDEFWFLPAMFLSLVCSAGPTMWIYTRLLGERYREYTHYTNLRVGFDGLRVFRWMALVFVVAVFLTAPLALDCYARFDDDALYDNPFLSLGERRHAYADIRELRRVATFRAPNGNVVHTPYYQIVFGDGSVWSTRVNTNFYQSDEEVVRPIIEFVSSRCGKAVVPYETAPD